MRNRLPRRIVILCHRLPAITGYVTLIFLRALVGPALSFAFAADFFEQLDLNLLDFEEESEEHTSELQSQSNLVCRLLLEKKNTHDALPLDSCHLYDVMVFARDDACSH